MSESVPSSVTGFAHRRPRADSIASFTYFQEDDESPEWSENQAIVVEEEEEGTGDGKQPEDGLDLDLESGSTSPQRRKSSGFSGLSAQHPLLRRYDSTKTDASGIGQGARSSQKIYVVTEDLTVVVAGFITSPFGLVLYLAICILSAGLGYLILRWLPRWRVCLVGTTRPLRDCKWVVIEVRSPTRRGGRNSVAKVDQDQWGQFSVQEISKTPYGHAASTVFGTKGSEGYPLDYDEEDDPVMTYLRFLDYRYIRFCCHPSKDKFVLCSDWKDPSWTDVKSIRAGLDGDERQRRERVFGKNEIEIEQKSVPQLLVDEVSINLCEVCGYD